MTNTWARKLLSKKRNLILEFERPVNTQFALELDVHEDGGIINLILESESVYIQKHVVGQKGMEKANADKILVEIPHTGFEKIWPDLWKKTVLRKLRKLGATKAEALDEWVEYQARMTTLANLRRAK